MMGRQTHRSRWSTISAWKTRSPRKIYFSAQTRYAEEYRDQGRGPADNHSRTPRTGRSTAQRAAVICYNLA